MELISLNIHGAKCLVVNFAAALIAALSNAAFTLNPARVDVLPISFMVSSWLVNGRLQYRCSHALALAFGRRFVRKAFVQSNRLLIASTVGKL
jgi:hypothetical protein